MSVGRLAGLDVAPPAPRAGVIPSLLAFAASLLDLAAPLALADVLAGAAAVAGLLTAPLVARRSAWAAGAGALLLAAAHAASDAAVARVPLAVATTLLLLHLGGKR